MSGASRSDNLRAAMFMMLSMACFTINDTFLKTLAGEVPLGQAIALRGLGVLSILGLWAARQGALRVRISGQDRVALSWRTVGEMLSVTFFLTALFNLPIATATAILQVLPLTVALGAAIFFGEPLGWRRMLAILLGLLGVLLIIRPGGATFDPYMFMALAAVGAVTLRDLATRKISRSVPGPTAAFWSAVGVTAVGFVMGLGEDWVRPSPAHIFSLAGSVLFIIGALLFGIATVRTGDMTFAAPFRYTGVLWALLLGLVVFGEWPDALTLLGVGLVVASGVFTMWREARRRSAARDISGRGA